jgi:hypothetical protein
MSMNWFWGKKKHHGGSHDYNKEEESEIFETMTEPQKRLFMAYMQKQKKGRNVRGNDNHQAKIAPDNDYDSDASSAAANSEDSDSENPELEYDLHLPNRVRVQNIFDGLNNFTLQGNIAEATNYTPTEEDLQLQENIRSLFHAHGGSPKLWSSDTILPILYKIVDKQDVLLHPHEKQMYDSADMVRLTQAEKRTLQLFYPNLVRLMMAMIAHVHNTRLKTSVLNKHLQPKSAVLGIWKHTLSELNEVLNIIVYANKENDDFLGDYPTAWLQLVHNRNGEISSLKKGIHALNDKIYKLQTILNTREKELEEVKSRYANHEDELEVSQSHLQNLEEKLLQLLDVKIIVENNLAQLRKFPDMEKAAQKLNKSQQALNTTTSTKFPFHAYNFY